MASAARVKGWFRIDGLQDGDRDLSQQLLGLDPLLASVKGLSVLDVGCAEGLIAMECAKAGATMVRGIEIIPGHVKVAKELKGDLPCEFLVGDANTFTPGRTYDVVLLLALLHKCWNPSEVCRRLASAAKSLCVIRLPGSSVGQTIIDIRSENRPHYIGAVMIELGFMLERETIGPFSEPTHYWIR